MGEPTAFTGMVYESNEPFGPILFPDGGWVGLNSQEMKRETKVRRTSPLSPNEESTRKHKESMSRGSRAKKFGAPGVERRMDRKINKVPCSKAFHLPRWSNLGGVHEYLLHLLGGGGEGKAQGRPFFVNRSLMPFPGREAKLQDRRSTVVYGNRSMQRGGAFWGMEETILSRRR